MVDLSDDAIVVRGGRNRDVGIIRESVLDAIEMGDGPVLSAFAADPLDGETIEICALRICRDAKVPHGQIQVTTARALREVGLELEHATADGQALNHYHVHFDEPVRQSQVSDFVDCFEGPVPNPRPADERKKER